MQKAACPNDLDQARPTCTPHVAPQDHELKHYYVIFSDIFHELIAHRLNVNCTGNSRKCGEEGTKQC